jgi:glycosyltransferase involved in cell wall biosynthesis
LPADPADPGVQPPVAIVVANYRWYKGHDILIDALELVKVPLVVRLCGEGDINETAARAETRGVRQMIEFVPDPADVPAELRSVQFAIHPSTQEGLSNAILEEMAAGLPVVAADVGGNPLLVNENTGRLVPVSDPAALAVAIDELAGDPSARVVMGRAARAHAADFDWAACASRYEALMTRSRRRS